MENSKIPVGISQCLLGDQVRYNGGHKLSKYCRDQLSDWFEYTTVCPEVEIGLGVPRPAMRLVADTDTPEQIRVLEIKNQDVEHTQALQSLVPSKLSQLSELCGFIFMQNSPSCGAFRVKVYHENGHLLHTKGVGVFANNLQQSMPWLPVEEAGRLMDPVLRENFITRVFVYAEYRELMADITSPKAIIDFHTRHKYLLLAHSQRHYRLLGKLLSRAGFYSLSVLSARYRNLLMHGLRVLAKRGGYVNALQHMQGYLKRDLNTEQKAELSELITSYGAGDVPLVVPLTMLRHYRSLANENYQGQVLLQPHPKKMGLYNNI